MAAMGNSRNDPRPGTQLVDLQTCAREFGLTEPSAGTGYYLYTLAKFGQAVAKRCGHGLHRTQKCREHCNALEEEGASHRDECQRFHS